MKILDPVKAIAGKEEEFTTLIHTEAMLMYDQARSPQVLRRKEMFVTTLSYILEFLCLDMSEEVRDKLKEASDMVGTVSTGLYSSLYLKLRNLEVLTPYEALFVLAYKQKHPYRAKMDEAACGSLRESSPYDSSAVEVIPVLSLAYPETRQYAQKVLTEQREAIKEKIFGETLSTNTATDFISVYVLGNLLAAKAADLDVDVTKVSKLEPFWKHSNLNINYILSSFLYELFMWRLLAADRIEITEKGLTASNFDSGFDMEKELPIPQIRRF